MREWAQTAAMRRGPLNGITARHVMKSEKGQAILLHLGHRQQVMSLKSYGSLTARARSAARVLRAPVGLVCLHICASVCVPGASRLI